MSNLPALIILYACIQMLFGLGSAAAFIFVVWPHLRRADKVGKQFSEWLNFMQGIGNKKE